MVLHFDVGGLHCDGCAASVRSTISRIPGVRQCSVSFKHGTAEVVFDPASHDADLDADDDPLDALLRRIVEDVEELGFTIDRRES